MGGTYSTHWEMGNAYKILVLHSRNRIDPFASYFFCHRIQVRNTQYFSYAFVSCFIVCLITSPYQHVPGTSFQKPGFCFHHFLKSPTLQCPHKPAETVIALYHFICLHVYFRVSVFEVRFMTPHIRLNLGISVSDLNKRKKR